METSELKKIAPVTLQEQLKDALLKEIHDHTYKPGDRIPTEHELSDIYQVSRVTVRAAVKLLADEGLLVRKAGKGTFVRQIPYLESPNMGGSFTENCLNHHAVPSTTIVSHRIFEAPDSFADISDTGKILEITRIRSVNKEPCIVEVDYFPDTYEFLLSPELDGKSFIRAIAKEKNIYADRFIDEFTVVYASRKFSTYLHCPIRTPLLKVMQTVKTKEHRVVYKNAQYILTSKYVYVKS